MKKCSPQLAQQQGTQRRLHRGDIMAAETRSRVMSKIRGRDTKPERAIAALLSSQGHVFETHAPDLPGRPDFVFRQSRVAVDRAALLAKLAVDVWSAPSLPADILNQYRPRASSATYSIADHSHLQAGPCRDLFEALRKEILALDACVSEEFLKHYVAYKAETNFVDIVPQAKQLRLSLNMPFADIQDPRDLCKDVSSIGRWGNGDVEVRLSSSEQLPYIMGLIRQSFERQMGNGA